MVAFYLDFFSRGEQQQSGRPGSGVSGQGSRVRKNAMGKNEEQEAELRTVPEPLELLISLEQ